MTTETHLDVPRNIKRATIDLAVSFNAFISAVDRRDTNGIAVWGSLYFHDRERLGIDEIDWPAEPLRESLELAKESCRRQQLSTPTVAPDLTPTT